MNFSRAFDEFARMELPQFVHETLIRETQKDRLIGHIARDSTAIEVRERFPEKRQQAADQPGKVKAKRGPKGGRRGRTSGIKVASRNTRRRKVRGCINNARWS